MWSHVRVPPGCYTKARCCGGLCIAIIDSDTPLELFVMRIRYSITCGWEEDLRSNIRVLEHIYPTLKKEEYTNFADHPIH